MRRGILLLGGALGIVLSVAGIWAAVAQAAEVPAGDFSLQITPSPLVTTVKPGVKTTIELKVRNGGTGDEDLKIEPRGFTLSNDSTEIQLLDTAPPGIAEWISFSQPTFTIKSGQWVTEQITLDIPPEAGFSYSFALVISRQDDPQAIEGSRVLQGQVAIFTLINIDRPDATSKLEVAEFSTTRGVYEYLPATFTVRFNNTGNTIAQPYGNIFIEQGGEQVGTLPVNDARGYILPDTNRAITADWTDGFPAYHTVQNADGTTSQKLVWDWTKLSSIRIGRYTAKLVGVYSQAGRDVPIEATVSFWVIPWRILGVLLLIVLLILFALFMLVRSVVRRIKRGRSKHADKKSQKNE